MKRKFFFSVPLIMTFIVGIIYGILIHRYHVFPYEYIKIAYNHSVQKQVDPYLSHRWSIGIYEGSNPFDLVDPKNVSNPVLEGKDIVDIDAAFVADPFMIFKNGRYYMFFEVLNRETAQGDIGYAESTDGLDWKYKKIVIDETFHLSYPYIFKWNNNYYLIPESHQDLSVRVYKALSFPDKWKYVWKILSGHPYVDPSIFLYEGKWWLFVSSPENSYLNLYYSDHLLKGWKPHPMNPIVKFDKKAARPGGRIVNYNGKIYRFAQDYKQVFAYEIIELSEKSYIEKIASEKPIINMTAKGWNAAGMHHVDMHKIGDKWIAVVDGRNQ